MSNKDANAADVRVIEFARTCRAAAHAVALYPPGHPAIQAALDRHVDTCRTITKTGALPLEVETDTLLVEGESPARADPAVSELAALFHQYRIARLVVNRGTGLNLWRSLLLLLARRPQEVRDDGGIAQVWHSTGGSSIEIEEINYAALLRAAFGDPTALDTVLTWCLSSTPQADLDEPTLDALTKLSDDVDMIRELAAMLERSAAHDGPSAQAAAVLRLIQTIAERVARTRSADLRAMFRQFGQVLGRLSPHLLPELVSSPRAGGATVCGFKLLNAVAEQVPDGDAAHLVARWIIAEWGATDRLVEAFHTLAPDVDRQRRLLSIAHQEVAASPLGGEDAFGELWEKVEQILITYAIGRLSLRRTRASFRR